MGDRGHPQNRRTMWFEGCGHEPSGVLVVILLRREDDRLRTMRKRLQQSTPPLGEAAYRKQ